MADYFGYNKWQLLGVSWILIALYMFWAYILPEFNYTLRVYNSLQQEEKKIISAQNWEENLRELNQRHKDLEEYLSKFFVRLPDNNKMSAIVDQLYKQADIADITLSQMRPDERIDYQTYVELPVHVQVKGGYHQLGKFMNGIEQSKYLMKVDEVDIQASKDPDMPLTAQILVNVIILERGSEQREETDA